MCLKHTLDTKVWAMNNNIREVWAVETERQWHMALYRCQREATVRTEDDRSVADSSTWGGSVCHCLSVEQEKDWKQQGVPAVRCMDCQHGRSESAVCVFTWESQRERRRHGKDSQRSNTLPHRHALEADWAGSDWAVCSTVGYDLDTCRDNGFAEVTHTHTRSRGNYV